MAAYLGIDPGAKGALCILDSNSKQLWFMNTPGIDITPRAVYDWILDLNLITPIKRIAIEDVHAIYGTSAGSNFKFGMNTGMLHGIIGATGFGYELVTPKVWQKGCGVRFKKGMKAPDKKRAVASLALQLYPSALLYGPQGGLLDGRADALCIAHYLSIKYP